jgi:hypothetical protein
MAWPHLSQSKGIHGLSNDCHTGQHHSLDNSRPSPPQLVQMLKSSCHALRAHHGVRVLCMAAKQGPNAPILHAKLGQLHPIGVCARKPRVPPYLLTLRSSLST